MTFFILRNPENGERVITEDDASYPGWAKLGEALRAPVDFEDFDEATGAIVIDRDRRSDARTGREHIATLRSLKMAEAAMVLAGVVPTQGMLAEEALARGISVQVLAQRVMDNAAPLRARELQRIAEKNGL